MCKDITVILFIQLRDRAQQGQINNAGIWTLNQYWTWPFEPVILCLVHWASTALQDVIFQTHLLKSVTIAGVWGKNCWNVTYAQRRVCALKGSSVIFPCTYSYPSGQKVNEGYWTFNWNDVRPLEQFSGRVEFVGDKESNCTLRLTELQESDSGEYRFVFTTDAPRTVFRSLLRVQLIVTGD